MLAAGYVVSMVGVSGHEVGAGTHDAQQQQCDAVAYQHNHQTYVHEESADDMFSLRVLLNWSSSEADDTMYRNQWKSAINKADGGIFGK